MRTRQLVLAGGGYPFNDERSESLHFVVHHLADTCTLSNQHNVSSEFCGHSHAAAAAAAAAAATLGILHIIEIWAQSD